MHASEEMDLPPQQSTEVAEVRPQHDQSLTAPPYLSARRAGFWIRTAAELIDFAVLMVLFVFVYSFLYYLFEDVSTEAEIERLSEWAIAPLALFYRSAEIWFAATPAKWLLRLRIRNRDGTEADWTRLHNRFLFKQSQLILLILAMLFRLPPLEVIGSIVGIAVAIGCLRVFRPSRLAAHDEMAGTSVCYRNARAVRGFQPVLAADAPVPVHPLASITSTEARNQQSDNADSN